MAITLPENPNKNTNVQLGKDFFLQLNTGTADSPKWVTVGAQTTTALKLTADEIDISHKTSGGWKAVKAGSRQWSMESEALVVLNDEAADALQGAFLQGVEVNVRFTFPKAAKKAYTGWGSVTDFSMDTAHEDAASLSITINGNGPLKLEENAEIQDPAHSD